MELVRKWFARVGAVITTVSLAVFVPAMAWASTSGAYDVAVEAARSRRRGGFGIFGVASLLCCLVVVGGIVLAVVLISRNRKRR
ncbi:hypothetical protein SAMN05421812_103426 [Asanoa hainanensis]|uniref:Uncharacterized protein n=1 Tax=Asanoa hainanensis TaxID=560556 RepID=A0A239KCJ4_9ACTN|nr:hypothetical protein [Asanoa hainanensis]SNT15412.1 hypothetical protein SAMN05421812_103426 [Asanoa hainanensis]